MLELLEPKQIFLFVEVIQMTKYDLTVVFLKLIVHRLSGRKDCAKQEYKIKIEQIEAHQVVTISPTVYVYRDKHHRSKPDRCLITSWAISKMHGKSEQNGNQIVIEDVELLPGLYRYKLSFDKNRRSWYKEG